MSDRGKQNNNLGILGWLTGGRWGYERYLYSLHRITGIGLITYFLLHIIVTSSRLLGPATWDRVMGTVANPLFKLGEFAVFAAFAFHMFNGLRLILIEFGIAVGKAEEPVYPYRSSVNTQRPLSILVMVLAAIVVAVGGYRFFFMH